MTRLFVVLVLAVVAVVAVLVFTLARRVDPEPESAHLKTTSLEPVHPAPVGEESSTTVLTAPPTTVTTELPATSTTSKPKPVPVVAPEPSATGVVADVIRAGFARFGPDVAEQAVRVGQCESTLRPGVSNAGSLGVMQINVRWHLARLARLGYTPDDMFDATANVAVAADIYASSGWSPWSCRWAA